MERTAILNRILEIKREIRLADLHKAELDALNIKLGEIDQAEIEEQALKSAFTLQGLKRTQEVKDASNKIDRKAMFMLTQRDKLAKYGMALTDELKLTSIDNL